MAFLGCGIAGREAPQRSTPAAIVAEANERHYFDARMWYLDLEAAEGNEGLVYGDPVRIIRRRDSYLQVQSPSGYLGYVPADSLRLMDLDEWDRYHRGPFAVFTRELALDGRSDHGVDCSGLVQQAYAMNGVFLPRDSDQMANLGRLVGLPGWHTALLPGDLLFFTGSRRLVVHTGVYAGDGLVVHSRGRGVQVQSWTPGSPTYDESLRRDFAFARRLFD